MLSRKVDPSIPFAVREQQVVRGLASPVSAGFTVPGARSGQILSPGSVPVAGVHLLACGSRAGMGVRTAARPVGRSCLAMASTGPSFLRCGGLPTPQASLALSWSPLDRWDYQGLCAWAQGPLDRGEVPTAGPHWRCPRRHVPTSSLLSPGCPWEPCLLLLEKPRLWKVGASAQGRDRSFCPRAGQPWAQK